VEPISPPAALEQVAHVATIHPIVTPAEPRPIEIKVETSDEDPSRPARKGWWQRRFSP
jgi:hypothetical protein